jgi:hypothetical protein
MLRAMQFNKMAFVILLGLLAAQGILAHNNFYIDTTAKPPHVMLMLMPALILMLLLFILKNNRKILDTIDIKYLYLIHVVRIPVEIVLYYLSVEKVIPDSMTFEGNNFDIISGLLAFPIFYFGFIKPRLNKSILIGFNILCLLLLLNVVITGVLSVPYPFQLLNLEQPNIAMLYFPFVWLPAFMVPCVLFAHLVSLRQIIINRSIKTV